jgi:hypothetical protein
LRRGDQEEDPQDERCLLITGCNQISSPFHACYPHCLDALCNTKLHGCNYL